MFLLVLLYGVFGPNDSNFTGIWGVLLLLGGMAGLLSSTFELGQGAPNEIEITGCLAQALGLIGVAAGTTLIIIAWPIL